METSVERTIEYLQAALDSGNQLTETTFPLGQFSLQYNRNVELSKCKFTPGAQLFITAPVQHVVLRDASSSMEDRAIPFAISHFTTASVDLSSSNFICPLELNSSNHGCEDYVFKNARLEAGLIAPKVNFTSSLCLDELKLGGRIILEGATFPQFTTADGLTFLPSAHIVENEGDFRAARLAFGLLGNKELEGVFYAMEKRCHRKGLPISIFKPKALFARFVSALYDWTSIYGQSYERAFSWFLCTQLFFGLAYSICRGKFGLEPDGRIWKFTLAQLVKPFELFSAKQLPDFYEYVAGVSPSVGWAIAAGIHSIVSLSLLALFLLALRWRFKRGD